MNLPNRLTLSRLVLTFVLMGFLFAHGLTAKIIAFVLFLAACLTDFLDGWVARRRGETTDFGKIMDPVADKILVLGVFIAFVEMQLIPAWMVIIVAVREFLITGIRLFAVRRGTVLAAESAGKHKTVSQMAAIFFLLIFLIFRESALRQMFWNERVEDDFRAAILFLMGVTVALTFYSGYRFLWQNRKLIKSL